MTPEELVKVADLVAAKLAENPVSNKWELLNSWGPAVAVPVVCLAGLAIAAWRGFPKLLEWFEKQEHARQEREDKIREAYLNSMREMSGEIREAIEGSCAMRDAEGIKFADDQTAKFRRQAR